MKSLRHLALALLILLPAACASDPDPDPSPTAGATASPSAGPSITASPSAQPPASPSPGTTGSPPVCAAATGGGEGTDVKLVAVRVGSHAGYDRITFEFAPPKAPSPANTLPKYSVTKVDQVTQDGSGNPVEIGGAALYSLVMQGASGVDLSGPEPVVTYKGSREFKPNFPVLAELEHAGDFENVLSWGIGLKAPRCIKASQLNSPLRLVLDIPHS
jgi:hypothetical protein